MVDNIAIENLVGALKSDKKDNQSAYMAVVTKKDNDGTVWVQIAGSNIETPVEATSADVKSGDAVAVEWRNNRLYIAGNTSNPSAGVARVVNVENAARIANQAAQNAVADAGRAHEAADIAQADATRAQDSADDAQKSADDAQNSANQAFREMSYVENIVGVLELVAKNGDYELTEDTEVQENKWYFTRSGTDPDYEYSVVVNPEGNPQTQGWYELVDISDSIRNYVSSQLAVDDDGLWLQTAGMQTKVLLSATDGVVLYGTDGTIVGKYGQTAQIGDLAGFHIEMDGTELGFYEGRNKVAYISNQQLYITQSVVLQQMDLGTIYDGVTGFGQWSWKVHKNGQSPSRNNLNLKWIG